MRWPATSVRLGKCRNTSSSWLRRDTSPPYHLAYVYTGLGEADRAMDFLERAYEERAGSVYGIKGSYLFKSLHSHPRFQALLRRMDLA